MLNVVKYIRKQTTTNSPLKGKLLKTNCPGGEAYAPNRGVNIHGRVHLIGPKSVKPKKEWTPAQKVLHTFGQQYSFVESCWDVITGQVGVGMGT